MFNYLTLSLQIANMSYFKRITSNVEKINYGISLLLLIIVQNKSILLNIVFDLLLKIVITLIPKTCRSCCMCILFIYI